MPTIPYPLTANGLPAEMSIPIGFTAVWPFTIQQGYDTAVTAFTGSDTLVATVWPGDDLAQSFAPTMAWVTATSGTGTLTIVGSSTSSLAAGRYRMLVHVLVSSAKYQIHDGYLTLTAVPGSATAGTTYCSYDDCVREYAAIGNLAAKGDRAGFAEQREEARAWYDSIILRKYHDDSSVGSDTRFPSSVLFGWTRSGLEDSTIRGYLTSNKLLVTKAVKRANACYAVSRILGAQTSSSTDGQYRKEAGRFLAMAENLAKTTTVEIDTDADGVGDIPIDLGVIDVLRG